jgi:hypothetical protein
VPPARPADRVSRSVEATEIIRVGTLRRERRAERERQARHDHHEPPGDEPG